MLAPDYETLINRGGPRLVGFHHFWRDPHLIFIVQGSTLLGRLGKRQQEIGQSRTWKESAPCVAAFSSLCISPCGFILGFRGVLEEVKGSASSEVISCSRGSWGATLCFLGAKWELQATLGLRRRFFASATPGDSLEQSAVYVPSDGR